MSDAARKAVHEMVDEIPEPLLAAARGVLAAIAAGVTGEDLEDALEAYELLRLREEQAGDALVPLEDVGRRLGLE